MRNANYKITKYAGLSLALMFFLALILAGCAEKGPILLDVGYQTPGAKTEKKAKLVVGVSPFKDQRGKKPSLLGKRTIPSGEENDLVVQGTVAGIATAGLKRALESRGISVKDAGPWNLSREGMSAKGAAILLGGEIETLWLESTAVGLKTHLKASVQMKVTAGDVAEKKIIRTIDVSSNIEQDILYSREKLEEMLSEALTTALDQLFKDEELGKRLQ
ncbi:MAG TPA: YajG family lipoprotein [Nitrospirota bacterium]